MEMIVVNTTEQALQFLDEIVESKAILPKLVLLDLYLPRKEDGWQVLQKIKKQESSLTMLPVIILSSSDSADDTRDAYQLGSTAYSVKPFEYPEWIKYFENIRKHWMETVILPFANR
ncbi:response regulator [Dyadobacter psychrotolerans]|uniref:Response regulator n=1 Tax=Dyadobacter psychrotolerans TaxID=2541721 RepID=A0A4R5DMH9_9BACT|nr:response regulator [Dyadobacter psychrotolerans]